MGVSTYAPQLHLLIQVAATFQLVLVLMGLITFLWPLATPRTLPERADLDITVSPVLKWADLAVLAGTLVFIVVFW